MTESRLEVVDLLQQMIRNECVNDGSEASGHEARNADLLVSELGRLGRRLRDLRADAGPLLARRADRGQRQGCPVALLARPHRCRAGEPGHMVAGSLLRRAARRRGLGPGSRRHAEPDGVDVGRLRQAGEERLPAEGDPRPGRRRRRGGPRLPWRRLAGRARSRRGEVRLPDHRDRRHPTRGPLGAAAARHGGREGLVLVPAQGAR